MRPASRLHRAAVAALLGLAVALAQAGELTYEKARFDRAIAERRAIVVSFVADWCNTCAVQQPLVAELLAEPRFRHLTAFVADFDKDVELKRRLRVSQQSTVVVFKGGREVARASGQTRKDALAALLARSL